MSTTQLELLVERALPSCSLVRNSTYQSYDKDTKHTKERKLVSSTSFFHQQADVIGQVSLFIVLAARSPVTPLYSIIVSADSIVTRKTREKRVVFSLSSESEMWRMEDEAVEAGVGGCVSGHKGEKYKRTRERRRQLETRHFVCNRTVWSESRTEVLLPALVQSVLWLKLPVRLSASVLEWSSSTSRKKRPRVRGCLRKLLWREIKTEMISRLEVFVSCILLKCLW